MRKILYYILSAFVAVYILIQMGFNKIYLKNCQSSLILKFEEYVQAKHELERMIGELKIIKNMNSDKNNHSMKLLSHSVSNRTIKLDSKPPGRFHKFMLVDEITIDKFQIFSENDGKYYKFVFGIPTKMRAQNETYLSQTINSLLKDFTTIQSLNILIIIYAGDIDTNHCSQVIDLVNASFGDFFAAGAIEILCPKPIIYPSQVDVPLSLDDPIDRVRWRSKQNLDYAFLMSYASTKGEYYLQLEDDVIASDGYAPIIADHVDSVKNDMWFLIHFSSLGFIGKLMRCDDLISFSQYLLLYYANQPCDWLMNDYGKGLVCSSSMSSEICNGKLDEIYPHYSPSLFQHMGAVSSLNGNENNLKDPAFEENPARLRRYFNPPASIRSNFSIYSQFTARKLYQGTDIFWANSINPGNEIVIEFNIPQDLKGVIIRSGSEQHPKDELENGIVQYKMDGGEEFEHWCDFINGEAQCSFQNSHLVSALRVAATQSQASWLVFSHFECLL